MYYFKTTTIIFLLFLSIAFGSMLPPSAELGLNAFKVGKGRASDLKKKVPAVKQNNNNKG